MSRQPAARPTGAPPTQRGPGGPPPSGPPPGARGPPPGAGPPPGVRGPAPGQGPPPGMRPAGPSSGQPMQQQQRPPPQQPVPVVRKAAPPPPADDEDEIDEDYGDDDFVEDFEEEEQPKKPVVSASSVPAKPPITPSSVSVPNAAAVAQMIARENAQALAASSSSSVSATPVFASGPAQGGVLSASSASAVPQRKYVPLPSKQQRAVAASSKELSKKNVRARKILQQVSLSIERFDNLFNMDPMSRADLAAREKVKGRIRDMGSQYNEDWLSQEVQTEDQERYTLGIQAPDDLQAKVIVAREVAGSTATSSSSTSTSTSTGTGTQSELPTLSTTSTARLSSFLAQACAVVETLLSEGDSVSSSAAHGGGASAAFTQDPGSLGAISAAKLSLSCPSIFGPRSVRQVLFSRNRNQTVLIAYGKVDLEYHAQGPSTIPGQAPFHGTAHKGLVLQWDLLNPTHPSRVLLLDGTPSSICVDSQRQHIVYAGTEEGSVCVWDLREDVAIHRTVHEPPSNQSKVGHTHILRQASFTTDCMVEENHEAPVRRIQSLTEWNLRKGGAGVDGGKVDEEDATFDFSALTLGGAGSLASNFQFASLDGMGGLYVWTVMELNASTLDPAGSETDLGLYPGSRLKLVKSSKLAFSSTTATQAYDVSFKPDETNEYILGQGRGLVKRGRRYGARPIPSEYTQLSHTNVGDDPASVAFHPIHTEYFLVGYKSGSISLYHLSSSLALATWWHVFPSSGSDSVGYAGSASGVVAVEWSSFRDSLFLALDAKGNVQLFDLLKSPSKPIASAVLLPSGSAAAPSSQPSIALSCASNKSLGLSTHMLAFPVSASTVEVHALRPAFSVINEGEREKFRDWLKHVHASA